MVSYLQLAHNERHPETGSPVARAIHNVGCADQVDREAPRRLVASISRVLGPAEAVDAAGGLEEVEVVDARHCGGAYALDALFARLGITAALCKAAAGRRLDAELAERICFALVAQRALEPGSKLAATRWAAERVALPGRPTFADAAAYRAMDFLLAALPEIAEDVLWQHGQPAQPRLRRDLRRHQLDRLRERHRKRRGRARRASRRAAGA